MWGVGSLQVTKHSRKQKRVKVTYTRRQRSRRPSHACVECGRRTLCRAASEFPRPASGRMQPGRNSEAGPLQPCTISTVTKYLDSTQLRRCKKMFFV